MKELQAKIGYTFINENILRTALTHSSFANEKRKGIKSNERLEFLGDSVLSIVVSDYLFKNYDNLPEGELTKQRATLVCEKTLCEFSRSLELGKYLLLGKGEEVTNGRDRSSILADAFEAVIASIYLDGGVDKAREFVLNFVKEKIEKSGQFLYKDYKTILQEIIQKNPEEKLEYVVIDETGLDHNKSFVVEAHLNSNVIGKGIGRSKKEAEQQSAREALELMGIETR